MESNISGINGQGELAAFHFDVEFDLEYLNRRIDVSF